MICMTSPCVASKFKRFKSAKLLVLLCKVPLAPLVPGRSHLKRLLVSMQSMQGPQWLDQQSDRSKMQSCAFGTEALI
jgi:hypothetical protein